MRASQQELSPTTGKRKAVYDIPVMGLKSESDLTRNSTPSRDKSEEQGKRLKLDSSRDSTLPATEISKHDVIYGALALLKSNTPEQILDVQLPYSKYLQLEKAFSGLNPESGTIGEKSIHPCHTIVAAVMSTKLECIGSTTRSILTLRIYLSTHSPQSLLSIVPLGSTTMRGFHGAFAKCVKQPDGGVWYISRKGKKMVTVVVEVGASERYKKLCRDKDIWIHGLGVKVLILACVNESPQFKVPSAEYDDIQDLEAEIALMDESMAATLESNLLLNRIAPFVYRSHKWGGQLHTAFIEVWRPNSIPTRYDLIQNGDTCDHLPPTLGLHVSDLFPDDEWDIMDIPDHIIPFDARRYLGTLMLAMNGTAHNRFVSFIKEKEEDEQEGEQGQGEQGQEEEA
ncbi:hypothetical protein V1508DRAFT_443040 [Lipomyces doorenjongii]|uniref:uncharacterized protein n=1 Tax=Lipomyces doorenjongii TaxID=383834 RepID=UPI0034D01F78